MTYEIALIDPAWPYYGSTTKDAAAGKHYELMSWEDLSAMPVRDLFGKKGAVFMWATSPLMDKQIDVLRDWGFYYRGIAHIWVKTRKDGGIIHGQGVPPTYSKPTTECLLLGTVEEPSEDGDDDATQYLLLGTTTKKGRTSPLLDSALPQVVLAPRERHSKKPDIFHELIERGYGDRPRIELFAREHRPGWDATGLELDGTNYLEGRLTPKERG